MRAGGDDEGADGGEGGVAGHAAVVGFEEAFGGEVVVEDGGEVESDRVGARELVEDFVAGAEEVAVVAVRGVDAEEGEVAEARGGGR